jgi:hypothetical protein
VRCSASPGPPAACTPTRGRGVPLTGPNESGVSDDPSGVDSSRWRPAPRSCRLHLHTHRLPACSALPQTPAAHALTGVAGGGRTARGWCTGQARRGFVYTIVRPVVPLARPQDELRSGQAGLLARRLRTGHPSRDPGVQALSALCPAVSRPDVAFPPAARSPSTNAALLSRWLVKFGWTTSYVSRDATRLFLAESAPFPG